MSLEGAATGTNALRGKIHSLVIDKSLSIEGACADAKAVGDALGNLSLPSSSHTTDTTLSIPGACADAKTVGDTFRSLNFPEYSHETDATLSIPGACADAKAVGDALAKIVLEPTEFVAMNAAEIIAICK